MEHVTPVIIYFATWLEEKSQDLSLSRRGAWNRLLSYHFIQKGKALLRDYLLGSIE
jgi:hypothetical protein